MADKEKEEETIKLEKETTNIINNIQEENKKLRLQIEKMKKVKPVELTEYKCDTKQQKTQVIKLTPSDIRPPRHTFNFSFLEPLIVTIRNQIKVVQQNGINKVNALETSFASITTDIDMRVKDMKDTENKNNIISENHDDGITSEKTQGFVEKAIKTYLKNAVYQAKKTRNENIKFYVHNLHKKLKYVAKFQELMAISKKSFDIHTNTKEGEDDKKEWSYKDYQEILDKISQESYGIETLDSVMQELLANIEQACSTYIIAYNKHVEELKKYENLFPSDMHLVINEYFDQTSKQLSLIRSKLISLYSKEYSIMDIILDSHFITIYVLKAIHFLVILVSLFLTEKIFSEMYMKKVYAENGSPPNLVNMLLVFFVIDFGFILFLLTVLFLLMYIFQKPSKDFLINGELIKMFLIDYFVFAILLFVILCIVAVYMQSKKYFRYNTEGLRAIRALKDIITPLAGVLLCVPFFTIM